MASRLAGIACFLCGATAAAQSQPLTLESIYAKREFDAKGYSAQWFDEDSYTTLDKAGPGRQIVRHSVEDGTKEVLVSTRRLTPRGKRKPLEVAAYTWSKDRSRLLIFTNTRRVWRQHTRGDYWLFDRNKNTLRQLGGDAPEARMMFARFSPDGESVAWVRDRDLYVEHIETAKITRLTHAESAHIINGTTDWVYEEELSLRDAFRWSPDSQSIAYWQFDTTDVPEFVMIDNTSERYPRLLRWPYPKVGETNSSCRIGVISRGGGDTRWMQVPGDPRNHYLARMEWTAGGDLLIQQLNRLQNRNRVFRGDPANGSVRPLFTESDRAWVDVHDEVFWFGEGKRFTWISERSGWRHVYLAGLDGTLRQATSGQWDVIELLHIDEAGEFLYLLASLENATRKHLYRVRTNGTELTRLSPVDQPGTHRYDISPDGRYAIHTWSRFGTPPQTDLIKLATHETVRMLEDNAALKKRLAAQKMPFAEFLRVPIAGGTVLDGWSLKPPDFDEKRRYPLLVYVYGEPAGQSVLDRWGGSNYLWHSLLAQHGYVVMCFDNRGTPAPRGRAWRKSVYRRVGILAPQDQAAAVRRVLAGSPWLDGNRVGSWGWSGGGSMTLNALFKYPDVYQVGISVAPVPDQLGYDTIYQERYMGLPQSNSGGYHQGSPIHFAKGLKGKLLLVHGTGDDNCHYATTEKLVDELIRLNKPFQLMAYPNRTHAIREGENTTLHLRQLMTDFLLTHLSPEAE